VVCECYIDGMLEGEAVLPSNWRRVLHHSPELDQSYDAFVNKQTDDVQVDDRRLGPLRVGWRFADHSKLQAYDRFPNEETRLFDTRIDPCMTSEALKARGVELHEFRPI